MENNRKLRDTGYLYDPSTAEFVEERARVKDLCFEYNNLTPQVTLSGSMRCLTRS